MFYLVCGHTGKYVLQYKLNRTLTLFSQLCGEDKWLN